MISIILTTLVVVAHHAAVTGIDWAVVGETLGGLATFVVLLAVPVALLFHRKVIRPLRWVLGVTADDSPTGEAILPVPQQLAELRKAQEQILVASRELIDDGGNSIKDRVRMTHKLAMSTDRVLKEHLRNSAENEAEIWKAIALTDKHAAATALATDLMAKAAAEAAQLVQDQRTEDQEI